MSKKKKIVVIGGGTGTYHVLSGLKKYPVSLSAVVSMTDSGGSNRVIRDEFGLLPTSDIRQVMVALASDSSDEVLRKLFTYRYNAGTGISGMTYGNLFMAALTDIYGNQEKAIEKTCEILNVKGKIIPVTYDNTNLVARYDNGEQVLGEHYIDEPDERLGQHKIAELEVFPRANANKKALTAIEKADLIVLGP
ncbi:MAG: 2-phospho-L-lactate transferase CofD family protein, partial [Patescibacteria group bacterium]